MSGRCLSWVVGRWKQRRLDHFKRILYIQYTYKTREKGIFESATTIEVIKDGLREYKTGLGGTRILTSIDALDPRMRVVPDPTPTGDRRHFTVFIDPPLAKGGHVIPLEGEFTDPNVENPNVQFRLPVNLGELVIVIRLNPQEKVKGAFSSILKPGKHDYLCRRQLRIWRNNTFVASFQGIRPGWTYEVTWNYAEPKVSLSNQNLV